MAENFILTPELCRKWLRYEAETGKLFWLKRDDSDFESTIARPSSLRAKTFNDNKAGKEAFTTRRKDKNGNPSYYFGSILKKVVDAHRVIWAIVYGHWPNVIDHIDGNKINNKLENLRNVDYVENNRNLPKPKKNKSGFTGVRFYRPRNKWSARIQVNGKDIHLGYFLTIEEAIESRKKANDFYGFHKNHGRSTADSF